MKRSAGCTPMSTFPRAAGKATAKETGTVYLFDEGFTLLKTLFK
jgi:hypothetical protein